MTRKRMVGVDLPRRHPRSRATQRLGRGAVPGRAAVRGGDREDGQARQARGEGGRLRPAPRARISSVTLSGVAPWREWPKSSMPATAGRGRPAAPARTCAAGSGCNRIGPGLEGQAGHVADIGGVEGGEGEPVGDGRGGNHPVDDPPPGIAELGDDGAIGADLGLAEVQARHMAQHRVQIGAPDGRPGRIPVDAVLQLDPSHGREERPRIEALQPGGEDVVVAHVDGDARIKQHRQDSEARTFGEVDGLALLDGWGLGKGRQLRDHLFQPAFLLGGILQPAHDEHVSSLLDLHLDVRFDAERARQPQRDAVAALEGLAADGNHSDIL